DARSCRQVVAPVVRPLQDDGAEQPGRHAPDQLGGQEAGGHAQEDGRHRGGYPRTARTVERPPRRGARAARYTAADAAASTDTRPRVAVRPTGPTQWRMAAQPTPRAIDTHSVRPRRAGGRGRPVRRARLTASTSAPVR